jgi:hypothetical protein
VEVLALSESDFDQIIYLAGCTLARKAGKNNWVEEDAVNGLPEYICRIARAILRGDGSKTISQAIAIAVGRVKTWARGGGGVNADTRAKAAAALAQWEKKKAAAKANNKVKLSSSEITLDLANSKSWSMDEVRRQYKTGNSPSGPEYTWVREVWTDFIIVTKEATSGESAKTVRVPYIMKDGKAEFGTEEEVKQSWVTLSADELQTHLTDAQLEKAALVPCTEKDRGGLSVMVALSSRVNSEILELSLSKPALRNLLLGG